MNPILLRPGTVIWKHKLDLQCIQARDFPRGADIIHVDVQEMSGDICIWFACVPEADPITRWFTIIGTGQPFPSGLLRHLGTAQQGAFVWHVFECEAP